MKRFSGSLIRATAFRKDRQGADFINACISCFCQKDIADVCVCERERDGGGGWGGGVAVFPRFAWNCIKCSFIPHALGAGVDCGSYISIPFSDFSSMFSCFIPQTV